SQARGEKKDPPVISTDLQRCEKSHYEAKGGGCGSKRGVTSAIQRASWETSTSSILAPSFNFMTSSEKKPLVRKLPFIARSALTISLKEMTVSEPTTPSSSVR